MIKLERKNSDNHIRLRDLAIGSLFIIPNNRSWEAFNGEIKS